MESERDRHAQREHAHTSLVEGRMNVNGPGKTAFMVLNNAFQKQVPTAKINDDGTGTDRNI